MFQLFEESLEEIVTKKSGPSEDSGAVVTFEGRVRNVNDGKKVLRLEYQSYQEMAVMEGEQIISEARHKFPSLNDCYCVHRTGTLEIGDLAVWVICSSRHRREAFEACQFVIDEVKKRVPIWKNEHYQDGTREWVACHRCQGKG